MSLPDDHRQALVRLRLTVDGFTCLCVTFLTLAPVFFPLIRFLRFIFYSESLHSRIGADQTLFFQRERRRRPQVGPSPAPPAFQTVGWQEAREPARADQGAGQVHDGSYLGWWTVVEVPWTSAEYFS